MLEPVGKLNMDINDNIGGMWSYSNIDLNT